MPEARGINTIETVTIFTTCGVGQGDYYTTTVDSMHDIYTKLSRVQPSTENGHPYSLPVQEIGVWSRGRIF